MRKLLGGVIGVHALKDTTRERLFPAALETQSDVRVASATNSEIADVNACLLASHA
jgi:hypothetical protein